MKFFRFITSERNTRQAARLACGGDEEMERHEHCAARSQAQAGTSLGPDIRALLHPSARTLENLKRVLEIPWIEKKFVKNQTKSRGPNTRAGSVQR
jgi:hypothetical protein